jgi:preprotein translocase subunit SecE
MKKQKNKGKGALKEAGANPARGQVVKLRPAKPRVPLSARLPSPARHIRITREFLVEAWGELKKVTWPVRRETIGTTAIVLVLVALISLFLGLVDFGLSRLVSHVIR